MSLNKFIGIGNLCADVEVRQVGQTSVGKVNLAMTERYTKQDGTRGEQTEFLTCELWGKDAVYPYLKKGQQVYVEGSIRTETWEDQYEQKRYNTKCRVQTIQLLGSRPSAESQVTQAAAQVQAQQHPQYQQQYPPQYQPPQYQPPQPRQAPQPKMPPQPAFPPQYSAVAQPPRPQYDPNDLPPDVDPLLL